MKLGLIVESTERGMETVVCPKILQLLSRETKTPISVEGNVVSMTGKKTLLLRCTEAVQVLFKKGCQRVVILWDENPPWTPESDFADERCWATERNQILQNLAAAQVDDTKVGLVCIEREFETWLLHDERLLNAIVSTTAHSTSIKAIKHPLRVDSPKAHLKTLFREHHRTFNPDVVAFNVAQTLQDLDRLKKCDIFRYFAQQVLGEMPKGWKPYVYKRRGPRG